MKLTGVTWASMRKGEWPLRLDIFNKTIENNTHIKRNISINEYTPSGLSANSSC